MFFFIKDAENIFTKGSFVDQCQDPECDFEYVQDVFEKINKSVSDFMSFLWYILIYMFPRAKFCLNKRRK